MRVLALSAYVRAIVRSNCLELKQVVFMGSAIGQNIAARHGHMTGLP